MIDGKERNGKERKEMALNGKRNKVQHSDLKCNTVD